MGKKWKIQGFHNLSRQILTTYADEVDLFKNVIKVQKKPFLVYNNNNNNLFSDRLHERKHCTKQNIFIMIRAKVLRFISNRFTNKYFLYHETLTVVALPRRCCWIFAPNTWSGFGSSATGFKRRAPNLRYCWEKFTNYHKAVGPVGPSSVTNYRVADITWGLFYLYHTEKVQALQPTVYSFGLLRILMQLFGIISNIVFFQHVGWRCCRWSSNWTIHIAKWNRW